MSIINVKKASSIVLGIFVVSLFYSYGFIYGNEVFNLPNLIMSYVPIFSLVVYAVVLAPFGNNNLSKRIDRYSVISIISMLLMIVAYLYMRVLPYQELGIFFIIMSLISVVSHTLLMREISLIDKDEYEDYKNFVLNSSGTFFDSNEVKRVRRYKYICGILLLVFATTPPEWVFYIIFVMCMYLWVIEYRILSNYFKDKKSLHKQWFIYETLDLIILIVTLTMYILNIILLVPLLIILNDFPYYFIKSKYFSLMWLEHKDRLYNY